MARALLLDRDGVINHDLGYVHRPEQVRFVAGIFDLARAAGVAGYQIIVVTNQSGIGRGLFTENQYQALTSWIIDRFHDEGVTIRKVYHCPDHPTAGTGAYRRESSWRKPAPGMILQAAADFDLDLATSALLGDQARDMQAARAAAVGLALLYDPSGALPEVDCDLRCATLGEAEQALIAFAAQGSGLGSE